MDVTAVYCVAALGFLVFGLGFVISGTRKSLNQFYGAPTDPENILYKLNRAHGNTVEYAPYLAIIMLYLGAHSPAQWIHFSMIAATISRYVFVIGVVAFRTMAAPNVARFIGAMGTYVFGFALCVALLQSI